MPKTHWNYRTFKQKEKDSNDYHYSIRDVYYRDGEIDGYADSGVEIGGTSINELSETLKVMIISLDKAIIELDDNGDIIDKNI